MTIMERYAQLYWLDEDGDRTANRWLRTLLRNTIRKAQTMSERELDWLTREYMLWCCFNYGDLLDFAESLNPPVFTID